MNVMEQVEVRFIGEGVATLYGVIQHVGPVVTVKFGQGSATWIITAGRDLFQHTEDERWVLELS